jgi:hypothetical protein
MNKKTLILGAYGNFDSKIAKLLAKENIDYNHCDDYKRV